ncbi:hypothetical protein [Clostridium tagluense]|uniref:hypothetical protein n=1 Tax=Clostridium tagluense TaxID=360422 RepID=UPI001CF2C15C|nr:hypothetical protein [Clostridium tagluense]MCB2300836.1 hypothetical protein [Clostridium tagluense]
MKFKSITMILTLFLFILGISEFIMIFMKIRLPTIMVILSTILLFIISMSDYIKTKKLRKLAYPLIMIYFFVGMPIIERFIENKVLSIGFVVLGFIVTIIFVYNDLIINNKAKNLQH